jgi:translation initiation factor IF-3
LDENGTNLGIMPREAALKLAQEKGWDLIEISPVAKPPVARIMSFDKFRYQLEKKLKQQRVRQKNQELKQVQIGFTEAPHDLQIKAGRVNKFLKGGYLVEILLTLRGREKIYKDLAKNKLEKFLTIIEPNYRIVMNLKMGFKGLAVQIAKKL